MDLSIFLAQFLAVLYGSIGIGILLHKQHYSSVFEGVSRNAALLYLSGIFSLALGFSIVTIHAVWTNDWRSLVTLVGWIALLKGLTLIVWPSLMLRHIGFWLGRLHTVGIIALFLGLLFGYFGFVL